MSKQEEVLIELLGVKQLYKEYAETVQEIIDNPGLKKLSDEQCEMMLRILKSPAGTYKLVMQQRKKK